jgi:hypothetical protein
MKLLAPFLLLSALSGCGDFPRDQVGTLERIRSQHEVRIGRIASAAPPADAARLDALVRQAAAAAGGQPMVREGPAEPLLLMLEEGELDLVVGEFDAASPWVARVHLLPALATREQGEARIEATAAARNGENGWINLVEREARKLAAQ